MICEDAGVLKALYVLNEGLAFLVELAALGALAWWGARTGGWPLGVGAPLVAAVLWGLFAAPKARVRLPLPGVLAVKALVFVSAALGLYAIGRHGLAIGFGLVALVNTALATWERDRHPVFGRGEA